MRASEVLHGLAELLGKMEGDATPSVGLTPVPVSKFTPDTQEPESVECAGTFVPPLQAKIELLKKAVNVDSIYDQEGPDENLTGKGADNQDELDRLRKMAGVNPVVAAEAADDEPLDV